MVGHPEPFLRDRLEDELLRACALHDVRGALTSIWARPVDEVQDGLLERVAELLREVGAPPGRPWPLLTLWDALAMVESPEAARRAADAFAAGGMCELVVERSVGLAGGWSLAEARAERAACSVAWRWACVRMAARLCAVRMQVRLEDGSAALRFTPARA